jgi:putative transposase
VSAEERWPKRSSLRLANYDYAQNGAYFVTLCTAGRACLFGMVVDDAMQLNAYGVVAAREWSRTAEMRPTVILDAWVVMPNHVHGIVVIDWDDETTVGRGDIRQGGFAGDPRSPLRSGLEGGTMVRGPGKSALGAVIAGYKAAVTRGINGLSGVGQVAIWQRNYYEHVIRNDEDLRRIQRIYR